MLFEKEAKRNLGRSLMNKLENSFPGQYLMTRSRHYEIDHKDKEASHII